MPPIVVITDTNEQKYFATSAEGERILSITLGSQNVAKALKNKGTYVITQKGSGRRFRVYNANPNDESIIYPTPEQLRYDQDQQTKDQRIIELEEQVRLLKLRLENMVAIPEVPAIPVDPIVLINERLKKLEEWQTICLLQF